MLSLSAPVVAGAYESYESCGLTEPAKISMHGGFFAARITSTDTLLSFSGPDGQPPNDVKVQSFDQEKGVLVSASVRLQVAVSIKADCGPYGIMYDRPDFKAKIGATDKKWPYESKCFASDADCEKSNYQNFPCDSANCVFENGGGKGIGGSGNFESKDNSKASGVYYPYHDHCDVAVIRAEKTNMVLVNGYQVGVLHKGRNPGDAWTDCSARRMEKSDYPHLDVAGMGDDIRFCGTSKDNDAKGIPMGKDAIDYEWTSMVQDFSFAPLSEGKQIAELLNNDGMETITWRTREDGGGDEVWETMPGLGPPLRTVMYGPVQELDAEFWGRYCMHYVYNTTESDSDQTQSGESGGDSGGGDPAPSDEAVSRRGLESEVSAEEESVDEEKANMEELRAKAVEAASEASAAEASASEAAQLSEDAFSEAGTEAGSDSDAHRGPKSNWVTSQLVHGCHKCCCNPVSGTPRGIYYYGGCPEHLEYRADALLSDSDGLSGVESEAVARRQLKDRYYISPGQNSVTGEIASEECPYSPNWIDFAKSAAEGFQTSWDVGGQGSNKGLNACCSNNGVGDVKEVSSEGEVGTSEGEASDGASDSEVSAD